MDYYTGIIIEESLQDKTVLEQLNIIKTRNFSVTEKQQTPWIKQWTMHTVEIPPEQVVDAAIALSESIDMKHQNAWYVDFKNKTYQYVIFYNKVFYFAHDDIEEQQQALAYGREIGIPETQLDFV